jgi:tRNA (guanine-N7-)-methyltransferase
LFFNENSPPSPDLMDWSKHYPQLANRQQNDKFVEFADIGCGYGGLLVALSTVFPDKLILGLEIRPKVVEYVRERIQTLRQRHPGQYQNISVVLTNAMKYLPHYFRKGQLSKIFFLFPDPHFKRKNTKRRIISSTLLAEYAYVLAIGGKAYTITDVKELADWMYKHFKEHPLFEEVPASEMDNDPVIPLVRDSTEEGKKVAKERGGKYLAVWRRIEDPFYHINNTNINKQL